MALALNNLKRVDMPLNKETKRKSQCLIRNNVTQICTYKLDASQTHWVPVVSTTSNDIHISIQEEVRDSN